jgi:hypothetical protein
VAYDLGAVVPLAIAITSDGVTPANAGAVALTLTLPDGTTLTPTPSNPTTGSYTYNYQTTQFGRHLVRWVATGANASAMTDEFEVNDPSDLDLISFADAKRHLGIPTTDTARDDLIRAVMDAATSLCEGHTSRAFRRQTVVETINGADPVSPFRGKLALKLLKTPVISITSVVENTFTLDPSVYVLSPDSGLVYRGSTWWRQPWLPGSQNITITYVAGFVTPPPAVVWAVKRLIEHLWQKSEQAPHPAFDHGSGADTEFNPTTAFALPYAVQTALEPFMDHGY